MSFSLNIDDKLFDELFPFSFVADNNLNITKAGTSLKKIFSKIEEYHISELFCIERPKHASLDYKTLQEISNHIIILKSIKHEKKLLFRYGITKISIDQIMFIGSPWITEATLLKDFELKLKDFANHDAITDLLQVLTVKNIVLDEVRELNDQLERSEYRYRLIVENAHDLIYNLDSSGHIIYVNKVVLEKTGISKDEIINSRFSVLIKAEFKEAFNDIIHNAKEEVIDKIYSEFPISTNGSEVIWLGQNLRANYDVDGNLISFFAVSRDITEQKELEENLRSAEERLRILISNLQSGILVEDEHRKIVLTNKMFCDIFNIPVSPKDLIGIDCSNAAEQSKEMFENPKGFVINIKKALKRKEVIVGHEMKMKSGRIFERDYIPIFLDDKYMGHLWQYRDITNIKKAEQKLISAKNEAQAAQEAERQFLAKMSHEIRTPLNAVVGMSHLLNETKTTSEQQEYIEILNSSADLLQSLISDILDLSKITAGQVDVLNKPFNLKRLIDNLYNSFAVKCYEKGIKLSLEYDDRIKSNIVGDKLLLNQVLLNLISNAIKFTSKGSIAIRVYLINYFQNQQSIGFEIKDTGIGISNDALSLIFESFKQANSEISRQYGGTGLGLAIVNQVVKLMEGDIDVKSKEGEGSSFTVEIPFKVGKETLSDPDESKNQEISFIENLSILVAEDNIMNRKYIGRLLENWSISYDMVENGEKAIELLKAKDFDMILMDIQMPVMDGFETTKMIRNIKDTSFQNIPIIALTASALSEHKKLAEDIGMNGFISKPFKPSTLKKTLIKFAKTSDEGSLQEVFSIDWVHLKNLYGSDIEHIKEMLELFLENIYPEFIEIKDLIISTNAIALKQKLHKIIPSFSMAGLPSLEGRLITLKDSITPLVDWKFFMKEYEKIANELEQGILIIKKEITRIS